MKRRALLAWFAALAAGPFVKASAVTRTDIALRNIDLNPTGSPLLVVYVGNDPADADLFDTWLGHRADGVQIDSGFANWEDWSGSIGWLIARWRPSGRRIFWSIPLIPKGAALADAARGDYDERYTAAARQLAASQPAGPIFIRTGWEFNAEWMPWSALGKADEFVGAYRRFVGAFDGASDRFVFEWTPNIGDHGLNPETAYPGDDYVDIIGMDFYYHSQWNSAVPDVAWEHMLEQPFGLNWHQRFAAQHNKPTAYSEWGVTLDSSGPYIRHAAEWFRAHHVIYQSYWNSDADFTGKLSDGRIPAAGAAYKEEFAVSEISK
jgi:Glycosyl hydrolase family 26